MSDRYHGRLLRPVGRASARSTRSNALLAAACAAGTTPAASAASRVVAKTFALRSRRAIAAVSGAVTAAFHPFCVSPRSTGATYRCIVRANSA